MEVLDISTKSPRYLIAQIDFEFPDTDATQILKQEAVRDVGAIYKIDEAQIVLYRRTVENSLIEHQKWRDELPKSTFEELYNALDGVEEDLIQARFSDERTLNKMQELHLEIGEFYAVELPQQPCSIVLPQDF